MVLTHDETSGNWNAVAIDVGDNVAVALAELKESARVHLAGQHFSIPLMKPIPMGHKFAIKPIAKGTAVMKYGQVIGKATADIPAGAHVHVQNVTSDRAQMPDHGNGTDG